MRLSRTQLQKNPTLQSLIWTDTHHLVQPLRPFSFSWKHAPMYMTDHYNLVCVHLLLEQPIVMCDESDDQYNSLTHLNTKLSLKLIFCFSTIPYKH